MTLKARFQNKPVGAAPQGDASRSCRPREGRDRGVSAAGNRARCERAELERLAAAGRRAVAPDLAQDPAEVWLRGEAG